MEKQTLVIANWKMYLSASASQRAAESFLGLLKEDINTDVVICPAYTMLAPLKELFTGTKVQLGAQDVHYAEEGAYTGDVSVSEIKEFARYVIVGHSERRRYHGDTDEMVGEKVRLLLRGGMHPIICVGETAEEREAGETINKIRQQVATILNGLPTLDFPRIIFAYEPIWAISPGLGHSAPQPETMEVAEVVNLIRKVISEMGGGRYLEKIRVLYGGSVSSKTVKSFVKEPGVDGVLVGSASVKPAELIAIIKEVESCRS